MSPVPAVADPPALAGAFAPNLTTVAGRLGASWLEPVAIDDERAHRLRFARFEAGAWSEPVTIAEGADFFANWADFPAVVEAGDGTLYSHWLAKTAADTYAYSVYLARSTDEGASWDHLGKLNSDDTPTEHGFLTFVPEDDGARAFWLDGREMVTGEPMTLRSARVDEEGRAEELVDPRVCECCATDAVMTAEGPVVVYRDRSDTEVRDVAIARRSASGWTEPVAVHPDGWRIEGCPVNGPAVDANESMVAVAWFTASEDTAKVQVAFSRDSGATFDEPILLDVSGEGALVLGRVDLIADGDKSARVIWVTQTGDHAEIRAQRVAADGSLGDRQVVAETSAARASGFPILELVGERLFVAWVEVGQDRGASRVHVREI